MINMPQGDRTGPMGQGPRTGRGMGFCSGFNAPGYANPGFGRGFGRGMGFGRGRGFGFRRFANVPVAPVQPYQEPTKEQELKFLEQEAKEIEQEQKELNTELTEVKKRIQELKK
jgi:hypothetical protein